MIKKKKILLVVDAPGPAEFILPVVPLLKKKCEVSVVTVKDSPTRILGKYKPIRCDKEEDVENIYKKINPDILLVAISSLVLGPYVNNKFTELAHRDSKRIICFQDFWANHRWPMNSKMLKYWQVMLVPDKLAESYLKKDGYRGDVRITGNPSFDRFRKRDLEKEKKKLRKKFGVKNDECIILYIGQGTPQSHKEDAITFKFLIKGLKSLKEKNKIVIIARPHPRDENPERYKKLSQGIKILDTSKISLTDDVMAIADILVSMYSTNAIHACYLRIPTISILLPNAGRKMLKKISVNDFAPNEIGATIGVYENSTKILKEKIEKILTDKKYLLEINKKQKKYFSLSGKLSAEKVAEAVLKYAHQRIYF